MAESKPQTAVYKANTGNSRLRERAREVLTPKVSAAGQLRQGLQAGKGHGAVPTSLPGLSRHLPGERDRSELLGATLGHMSEPCCQPVPSGFPVSSNSSTSQMGNLGPEESGDLPEILAGSLPRWACLPGSLASKVTLSRPQLHGSLCSKLLPPSQAWEPHQGPFGSSQWVSPGWARWPLSYTLGE